MIVGVSPRRMDSKARVPRPGQVNTVSTTTAPEKMWENCSPAIVITGMTALRRACLQVTEVSPRPLARAVRMKSEPRTSIMLARARRL